MPGALLSLEGTCKELSYLWRGRARSSPLSGGDMPGDHLSLKGTCQEFSSLWRGRARRSPLSPCTCRPRVGVRADDDSDNENNRKQQGETPLRLIINYTNSKQSSLPSVWEGETISLSRRSPSSINMRDPR